MTTHEARYSELGSIGRGAEGEVFEVEDRVDGSRYALKRSLIGPEEIESLEGVWGSALDSGHQNLLVPIACRIPSANSAELLLPLIKTVDGHSLVTQGGPEVAYSLLIQVTKALAVLHGAGYCHRDLKPENILIEETTRPGPWSGARAILADLDLATPHGGHTNRAGVASGTVGFMAPEVLSGAPASPQSDLFSLGLWLFWLITGETPLHRTSLVESVSAARQFRELPPISRLDGRFAGGGWANLLARLTHKDPRKRPQDACEFLFTLIAESMLVSSESSAITEVLWTPTVLTHAELDQIRQVVESIVAMKGELVNGRIRVSRPEVARMLFQRLRLALRDDGFGSLMINPTYGFSRSSELIFNNPSTLVLIENCFQPEPFLNEELRALETIAGFESERARYFIVVESRVGSEQSGRDRESRYVAEISSAAHGSPEEHRAWVRSLFAGIQLEVAAHKSIERHAGFAPGATVERLRQLLAAKAFEPVGDQLVLLENRALASRWHAQPLGSAWGQDESRFELDVADVLMGLPFGLPLQVLDSLQAEVAGYAGALRRLMERGVLAIDRASGSLLSRPLAAHDRIIETSGSDGPITIATSALKSLLKPGVAEAEEATVLALRIRAHSGSRRDLARSIAAARLFFHKGDPGRALSMCHSLRRGAWDVMPLLARARVGLVQARALSCLGERAQLEGIWDDARQAAIGAERWGLAARVEYESKVSTIRRAAGFTRAAVDLLDRDRGRRWSEFRAEFELEELSLRGWERGFLGCRESAEELLVRAGRSDRCAASARYCLMRAAEEAGELDAAQAHRLAAIAHAAMSGHARTLARVVSGAAGFEIVHGRPRSGKQLMLQLDAIPRLRFLPTDLLAALSVRGGAEFEEGNLRSALTINRELLSLAIALAHARLEANTRRNIGLICLGMNRIGEALDVQSCAIKSAASGPGWVDYWTQRTCAVISMEVGSFDEAEKLLAEIEESSDALSRFQRADMSTQRAVLSFLNGDVGLALRATAEAYSLYVEEEAVDEQLKLLLLRAKYVPGLSRDPEWRSTAWGLAKSGLRMGQRRVWREFRLVMLLDSAQDRPQLALRRAGRFLSELRSWEEARLELEVLFMKASLETRLGLAAAADTIRDAMKLLRQTADGLAGYPGLREVYLADPRRQRFLELARTLKGS